MENILVIGIAGGTGSGKTTLMDNLVRRFGEVVTVLSHDNYYRRIAGDVNERGRTLESVLDQYQTTVKPMHEKYVEPSKKYANIVVPEGGRNFVALDMIMGRIQRHLDDTEEL